MSIPRSVRESVGRALEERGLGASITGVRPVGGGCINHGARIATDTGAALFLKWNPRAPAGMFAAEADGLRALAATRALRVPVPVAWGGGAEAEFWLLLEHVGPAAPLPETGERLGRGLAALHGFPSGEAFGWERDNWIGSLPQANTPAGDWAGFFRDRRIIPQLESARARGHLSDAVLDRLLDSIPAALGGVSRPELLHGDLWGGNWFAGPGAEPVLIDPAVYRGDGEVDLAMTELFGGFDGRFYDAYREAHGLTKEYAAYKRDVYQLYYLLVHVNLFGASYERGWLAAARRVVAELGA